MISQQKAWQTDFAKVTTALENGDWVVDNEEGRWLDMDAPEALSRPYHALVSMGYANGWIK